MDESREGKEIGVWKEDKAANYMLDRKFNFSFIIMY